jgi:hypothetical protein
MVGNMNREKLLFEFRSFGQDFGQAEEKLNMLGKNIAPKESYDYYILSEVNQTYNILIRNKRLVIKELIATVENLEKWNVEFDQHFPVSKEIIENTFFPALGLEAPNLEDKDYDIITFIEEVVNKDPDLKIVEVFKSKVEFIYNNCNCEIASNLINGAFIKTFNIESENVKEVHNTLDELNITGNFINTNYPLKIKQIIGLEPLKDYRI